MRLTAAMRRADRLIQETHGLSLRDYILRRNTAEPQLTIPSLAADLRVDKVTLYRWLDKLDIELAAGPRLIDRAKLRAIRAANAAVERLGDLPATGTEG